MIMKTKAEIAKIVQLLLIAYALCLSIAILLKSWYILSGALLLMVLSIIFINQRKNILGEDTEPYTVFFGGIETIFLATTILLLAPRIQTPFEQLQHSIILLTSTIIVLVAFTALFFKKYYRGYTYGTVVVVGNGKITVHIDYDFIHQIKQGTYTIDGMGVKEGDTVKIRLRRKWFKNEPIAICA